MQRPTIRLKCLFNANSKFPRFLGFNQFSSSVASLSFAETDKQLEVFPEYKEAKTYDLQGKFSKSLPNYERIYETLATTVGKESPLTNHLVSLISSNYRYLGQSSKAVGLLTKATSEINKNIEDKLRLSQQLVVVHLLSHQYSEALKVANEAVHLCEDLNHSDNHCSRLFSGLYGLLGVSHLMNGHLDDSETFFQMSCRWAETPTEQIISLSNNGTLVWYKLANESSSSSSSFNIWESQINSISSKFEFINSNDSFSKNNALIDQTSVVYKDYVFHSLTGWLDAVEEAQTGKFEVQLLFCFFIVFLCLVA
jgi:tetratricopeptide (TPR) repeat protein